MENIWYIEDVYLFKILCPTKFGNYKESHVVRTYKRDDFIYFTDDPAKNIFLISKGKVKVLNYTEQGEEVVKGILTVGDLFGEMVVLGEDKRTDVAQATENETKVCQMSI